MEAKVNELLQQRLTLVASEEVTPELLKSVENTRYQLMARIITRVLLEKKN